MAPRRGWRTRALAGSPTARSNHYPGGSAIAPETTSTSQTLMEVGQLLAAGVAGSTTVREGAATETSTVSRSTRRNRPQEDGQTIVDRLGVELADLNEVDEEAVISAREQGGTLRGATGEVQDPALHR